MPRPRQQRLEMSPAQREQLGSLFARVHTETRVIRAWDTDEGRAFLGYVNDLRRKGVPVAWIAEALELDPTVLQQVISTKRYSRLTRGETP